MPHPFLFSVDDDLGFDQGGGGQPEGQPTPPTEDESTPPAEPGPQPEAPPSAPPAPAPDLLPQEMLEKLVEIEISGGQKRTMKVADIAAQLRAARQAGNANYQSLQQAMRRLAELESQPPPLPQPDPAAMPVDDDPLSQRMGNLEKYMQAIGGHLQQQASQAQAQEQEATVVQMQNELMSEFQKTYDATPSLKAWPKERMLAMSAVYAGNLRASDPAIYANNVQLAFTDGLKMLIEDSRQVEARFLAQWKAGAAEGRRAKVQGAGGEAPIPQRQTPKTRDEEIAQVEADLERIMLD